METPSIKKEQTRNSLDAVAEAAEEEVKEKNIEKEDFEIESIKDSSKNGSCYQNANDVSVVEIECHQEESSIKESKAASPESGLVFGELEAALVNANADLALHDETNAYAFEVANGNQKQLEDIADQNVDDEAGEAADVDQLLEEDRTGEEANDRPIGSESESA